MRVLKSNPNELVLTTGYRELTVVYGFAIFVILIGISCLAFAVREFLWEWSAGMLRMDDWPEMASAAAFAGLFLVTGFLFLREFPAQNCVFDKRSGIATITNRPLIRICRPSIRRLDFPHIAAILLGEQWPSGCAASIVLDSGERIPLTPDFTAKASASESAERLCEFLERPLYVGVGTERVIKFPAGMSAAAQIAALSCPQCGGRLPTVSREASHAACPYCATNILMVWKGGASSDGETP